MKNKIHPMLRMWSLSSVIFRVLVQENVLSGAVTKLHHVFLFQFVISLGFYPRVVQVCSVGRTQVDDVRQNPVRKIIKWPDNKSRPLTCCPQCRRSSSCWPACIGRRRVACYSWDGPLEGHRPAEERVIWSVPSSCFLPFCLFLSDRRTGDGCEGWASPRLLDITLTNCKFSSNASSPLNT